VQNSQQFRERLGNAAPNGQTYHTSPSAPFEWMLEAKVAEEQAMVVQRRQHGIISRVQALECGMSRRQIGLRIESGAWIAQGRGVYLHSAVPPSWRASLLSACFRFGAVASHRSAAVLHGIDGFRPGRRELLVARGKQRSALRRGLDIHLHESTQMDRADVTFRDHIPCTGLARTVLDVAAVVSLKRLEHTIDAVVRDRMLEWIDLYDVLVRHSRRGRNGCGRLRAILDVRYGDETVPLSSWSRMVSDLLVDAGRPKPALEHRVLAADGSFVAQVDLAYPEHKLAIELDSIRWHLNHDSFRRDPRRRNKLILAGWTVLNFTWADYVDEPAQLCATVSAALRGHPPKLLRVLHL